MVYTLQKRATRTLTSVIVSALKRQRNYQGADLAKRSPTYENS